MYWADQGAADHYQVKDLSPEDAARASGRTGRKAQEDWRVSRALKHEVRRKADPGAVMSLSHSGGHAVCASAPAGWPLGADLENLRPRDFSRLAQWVCTPQEAAALAALTGPAQCQLFYLLWTLKEAFIKAAALDFPADMALFGLDPGPDGQWRLRAPPGSWRACSWRLGSAWMASVVWRAPTDNTTYPTWRGAVGCDLPALTLVGEWLRDAD